MGLIAAVAGTAPTPRLRAPRFVIGRSRCGTRNSANPGRGQSRHPDQKLAPGLKSPACWPINVRSHHTYGKRYRLPRSLGLETGGSITPFLRSGLGLDVVTDRLRLWITTRCRNRPGAVPSRLRLISAASLSSTCVGVLLGASICRKRSADLSRGARNAPKRMCATIGGMLSKMTCTCPPRNTVMAAFAPRSAMAAHRPIPPAARREHLCGLLWLFCCS